MSVGFRTDELIVWAETNPKRERLELMVKEAGVDDKRIEHWRRAGLPVAEWPNWFIVFPDAPRRTAAWHRDGLDPLPAHVRLTLRPDETFVRSHSSSRRQLLEVECVAEHDPAAEDALRPGLLVSFVDGGGGGRFKLDDNLVVDRNDGTKAVRFEPVPATHTENYIFELVARTNTALDDGGIHPLLVIAAFGLDFLCIHPFADGNGRVTRLLTAHLVQRAGYGVGRYVAVEQLIFDTKDDYYDTLAASTTGWFDDGTHSVWPWAGYFLDRIGEAYERFADRVAAGTSAGTKQDRIRNDVLLHAPARFTIADIRRAVPGVSDNTIRLVLTELKAAGKVTVDGTGRGTTWSRT